MRRLLTWVPVLLLLLSACSDDDPVDSQPRPLSSRPSTAPTLVEEAKPVGGSRCQPKALRTTTVDGDRFAHCVTAALRAARTARVDGEQVVEDQVVGAITGKVRFAPRQALQVTIFNGTAELRLIGGRAWLQDARGWVAAGTPTGRGQTASTQATLWRDATSLAVLRAFYASTPWRAITAPRDVNGVKVRGFRGTPSTGGAPGVPTTIWLSRANLPLIMESRVLVDGEQSNNKVTLSDFDQPIEITPPPRDRSR